MITLTLAEASVLFADILPTNNKRSALNRIVLKMQMIPIVPGTGRQPWQAARYDEDVIEDAILDYTDGLSERMGDLQRVDYREYNPRSGRFADSCESYLQTYSLAI